MRFALDCRWPSALAVKEEEVNALAMTGFIGKASLRGFAEAGAIHRPQDER